MHLMYHLPAEIIRDYGNVNEMYHVIRSILDCDRGSAAVSDTSGESCGKGTGRYGTEKNNQFSYQYKVAALAKKTRYLVFFSYQCAW